MTASAQALEIIAKIAQVAARESAIVRLEDEGLAGVGAAVRLSAIAACAGNRATSG